MRLNAVKVLEISITNASRNKILEEIQKSLSHRGKNTIIFTPNTEQIVFAHKNPEFASILNQADIAIPDSIGVARIAGIQRIPGVEIMEDLVEVAEKCHVPIGLIGGRNNLAVETLNCLRQTHGKLRDSWAEDGPEISGDTLPDDIYFERLARRIIREGTRIVFVALGPPKQEYFIERLSHVPCLLSHGIILMAVGGSFDILSGRLPRAPIFMRRIGLEWLWRLILEPRRWRRQLALLEFIGLLVRDKLHL